MRPGDQCEIAIWLNGTEPPEMIERFKTVECVAHARAAEVQFGVEIGPFECTIKKPGEERVPQVPDHISGPDVRLLVCVAKVFVGKPKSAVIMGHNGFIDDLDPNDLVRLRRITRMVRRRTNPGMSLSNAQCDQVINSMGPEAALKTLGKATN